MPSSPKKNIKPFIRAIQDVATLLPLIRDVHNFLNENDPFQAKLLLEKNKKIFKDLKDLEILKVTTKEQKELISNIQSLYSKMLKDINEDSESKIITISKFEGALEALQESLKKSA